MLQLLLSFIGGPIIKGLIDAYRLRIEAKGKEDQLATDLAVKEIEAEIPALKPVFSKIAGADPSRRKIPFQRGNFGLEPEEVRLLEEHGIVIEEPDGFYTSEIYRQGLQLTLDRGARPRVVVLLRRALGR